MHGSEPCIEMLVGMPSVEFEKLALPGFDFEGRPRQSIGERWIKPSPISDVVSLLRSFDAAAFAALFGLLEHLLMELAKQLQTCTPWLEIPLIGLLEAVNPAD